MAEIIAAQFVRTGIFIGLSWMHLPVLIPYLDDKVTNSGRSSLLNLWLIYKWIMCRTYGNVCSNESENTQEGNEDDEICQRVKRDFRSILEILG